ncbi:Fe-S cluster assembly ATPase SufC [Alphaproteobacteria bacterium]|jgi:Fe-S cluster assembly ATP-binding protein|nr:Fe-S cluster assembly ATPase SufC [Alphaproteobacteria bacterium]MDA8604233.1 Fe-S cluster assembly ATPase SufC [Alphaproteobacteria bacterium]MDA9175946.1 Fe-S cluster assembly ATPase SufC [Alphaproteobacteria bacterium]MDG1414372.1 Fe-S cluster assembly ATPase SufC [Alphaproteobacteria bacterium]
MLDIKGLQAGLEDGTEILKGINLSIGAGEVHAIMGPNGSGKSTTANILSGKSGYDVTAGSATLDGADLFEMEPEERAHAGLFQAFQYPVEIPGVQASTFLQTAVNAKRKVAGLPELDALAFVRELRAKAKQLGIGNDMLKRAVNVGFSGGEKKRFETLQMALLEPRLAVLDETDSGLDVDALRVVAEGVNALRSPDRSFLVITHYQRLLDYIVPDYVHILSDGKIVKSGDKSLALEVEQSGYAEFEAA